LFLNVWQRVSGESSKPLERIVMCERKTGKLVTGPAAPTENTLLSWLLRHPSFEVVQPTHQAPQPSMQLYTSQFSISINNVHIVSRTGPSL